ncbi:MAG: archaeosine biosynthesis radical SAM protein RaSEA [Thermoplasmata archaeon]
MVNRKLALFVKDLMPKQKNRGDNEKPVSIWNEMDRIRGYPEKSMVAIFKTKGCSWYRYSACSMCGYFNDISNPSVNDLKKQVDYVVSSLNTEVLKIFTSGSFLDPVEVPVEVRDYFFKSIQGKVKKLLIESRTEYINDKTMNELSKYDFSTRIAIGLESANDYIIENSINKGSTFSKYIQAANIIKRHGLELRTYLLFKPPFVSEREAINDILASIEKIAGITTDVSVNPVNVQKNTLVEYLWKKGLYRPPRLWSLAYILIEGARYGTEVISYPTGGNKPRGVHNDEFDDKLLDLIVDASLNQNIRDLKIYFDSIPLQNFWKMIDIEDKSLFQPDFKKLLDQKRSSFATV